jgi:hypothetical protein
MNYAKVFSGDAYKTFYEIYRMGGREAAADAMPGL